MQAGIAYYRVSTARQGRSGLGIDAQRATVIRFAELEGITLLEEFVEVETGRAPMRWTGARSSPPPLMPRARRSARWWSRSSTASPATLPSSPG